MGKKSKKKAKPKRSAKELYLAQLALPIPLNMAAPPRNTQQLAAFCLENLRILDKQDDRRFILFPKYLELKLDDLAEREDVWDESEVRFLKEIARDVTDLTYFRVQSLDLLALTLYERNHEYEEMVCRFEMIQKLCKKASEAEKGRQLPSGELVGEYLSERQRRAVAMCAKYQKEDVRVFKSRTKVVLEPTCAGDKCDNCQKTRAELEMDHLNYCADCKFEYYCSPKCQKSAWKNGHEKLCRKKGVYLVGDQAIDSNTWKQVTLEKYLETEDSWVVTECSGKNRHTVPTKKLRMLRPALWHDLDAYKFFDGMSQSDEAD